MPASNWKALAAGAAVVGLTVASGVAMPAA
jgi:hypothetical protein